jgi:ADP-heptose:LPS heptosyltransferase
MEPLLSPDAGPILLVMLDRHLGNNVLSLPVAERLARYFTGPVELLVDARYVALARLACPSARVQPAPSRGRRWRGPISEARWARLFARCAAKRYAAVFDFGGSKRQARLTRATMSPIRIGLHGQYQWAYTHTVGQERDEHMYRRVSRLLEPIGDTTPPPWPELEADQSSRQRVQTTIAQRFGETPDSLLILHPGAGRAYRRWPSERFAAVADALIEKRGMHVIVIGSKTERALGEQLRREMQRPDRAAVMSFNLIELVALFNQAALMVSNESGPTHLASMTQLPIVTLFGPTKEQWWRPVREARLTALRGQTCDPRCTREHCPVNLACLMNITTDDVLDAAGRVAPTIAIEQ